MTTHVNSVKQALPGHLRRTCEIEVVMFPSGSQVF